MVNDLVLNDISNLKDFNEMVDYIEAIIESERKYKRYLHDICYRVLVTLESNDYNVTTDDNMIKLICFVCCVWTRLNVNTYSEVLSNEYLHDKQSMDLSSAFHVLVHKNDKADAERFMKEIIQPAIASDRRKIQKKEVICNNSHEIFILVSAAIHHKFIRFEQHQELYVDALLNYYDVLKCSNFYGQRVYVDHLFEKCQHTLKDFRDFGGNRVLKNKLDKLLQKINDDRINGDDLTDRKYIGYISYSVEYDSFDDFNIYLRDVFTQKMNEPLEYLSGIANGCTSGIYTYTPFVGDIPHREYSKIESLFLPRDVSFENTLMKKTKNENEWYRTWFRDNYINDVYIPVINIWFNSSSYDVILQEIISSAYIPSEFYQSYTSKAITHVKNGHIYEGITMLSTIFDVVLRSILDEHNVYYKIIHKHDDTSVDISSSFYTLSKLIELITKHEVYLDENVAKELAHKLNDKDYENYRNRALHHQDVEVFCEKTAYDLVVLLIIVLFADKKHIVENLMT